MGHRNAISIFPHTGKMEFDCIPHGLLDALSGRAGCHATGKIRRECGVSRFCLFNYDKILVHFNPACLRMLLSVPGARSSPVLPAKGHTSSKAPTLFSTSRTVVSESAQSRDAFRALQSRLLT